MCGRYASTLPAELVARWFRTANDVPDAPPTYNAAPGRDVLAVRFNPQTGTRALDALRWGLVPHWAKDPAIGTRLINARAESIAGKPAFREAFGKRRCLIPANAFYEWRKDTKPKQPYAIRLKGGGIFAFAGLWEGWRDPAAGGEWIRTCTIVTTDANALVAPIHNRMPVILAPEDYAIWLGERTVPPETLQALLKPFPAERMEAFPVGLALNDARRDEPSLLIPANDHGR